MSRTRRASRKTNRREEILRAAENLILARGLSGVTTRQIARQAGCSEGALYVHFHGRLELLLAMLEETLPTMLVPLETLQQSVGHGSAPANLARALAGVFRFHQRATPLVAGLFADPALHAAYRTSLARQGKGPQLSLKALESYIAAEQRIGRIDRMVDSGLAANVLLSCSFLRAFSEQFFGTRLRPSWSTFSRRLIATVAPPASPSGR